MHSKACCPQFLLIPFKNTRENLLENMGKALACYFRYYPIFAVNRLTYFCNLLLLFIYTMFLDFCRGMEYYLIYKEKKYVILFWGGAFT